MAYTWIRGATAVVSLTVRSGTVTGSEVVRSVLKRQKPNESVIFDDLPTVLSLTPVFVAASGSDPARWDFSVTAEQTAPLKPGTYLMDARLDIGGQIMQTGQLPIVVVDRITGPAP